MTPADNQTTSESPSCGAACCALRDACNGHPYAKIPWPHRLLHEAADQIEDMAKRIRLQCDEWAEDHTHLQNLCRAAGCSDLEIEGDNYGLPGIIDLANLLRDRLSSHNAEVRHGAKGADLD